MQFTTFAIALLAAAPGVLSGSVGRVEMGKRDLHGFAWCYDITPAQDFKTGEQAVDNDAATSAACAAYKNRNTGTKQWDTCPDCVMGTNGAENAVCRSAASHIGGDEWNYYCRQAGADASGAS